MGFFTLTQTSCKTFFLLYTIRINKMVFILLRFLHTSQIQIIPWKIFSEGVLPYLIIVNELFTKGFLALAEISPFQFENIIALYAACHFHRSNPDYELVHVCLCSIELEETDSDVRKSSMISFSKGEINNFYNVTLKLGSISTSPGCKSAAPDKSLMLF